MKVKVTKDGKEVKVFTNQKSDIEGFAYILNNQSQSVSYAVKYEGWDVELIDEESGDVERYSDNAK